MADSKLSEGYELYNIYATLRKLKSIHQVHQNSASGIDTSILDVSIFSRKFLLKLLNSRLSELNLLCEELVSELFKRLTRKIKRNEKPSKNPANTFIQASRCHELDEYFHYSLYYLHDFFIELDWYETVADPVDDDSHYVETKLDYIKSFIAFQTSLTEYTNDQHVKSKTSPKDVSPTKSLKSIKSTLALSSKLDLPSRKRRVRFQDSSPGPNDRSQLDFQIAPDQNLINSHSIFALDLLLFSLNLFIQRLYNNLNDWQSNELTLGDSLKLICESKQKIRTSQLRSISKQIKSSNDVYLTILDHLLELRKIYLKNCVLNIICSPDAGRQLNLYKTTRVNIFIKNIILNVERKVISRLSEQCLQILLDLIISEINLPPVELGTGTRNKTRVELGKSRQNYLNFITSWMNVDDIVFGFVTQKKRTSQTDSRTKVDIIPIDATSTMVTGGQFKSSSRILAQMDNLNELMRDLFTEVCDRIQSHQQMKYFLELIHAGFDLSFNFIVAQLESQLTVAANEFKSSISSTTEIPEDLNAINKTVDMIAFKVRSLKCIHVLSSMDKLIKETATNHRIELEERSLEIKLEEFTEKCTQQTGSTFKS